MENLMSAVYIETNSDTLSRLETISNEQKLPLYEVIGQTVKALLSNEIELPTLAEIDVLKRDLDGSLLSIPLLIDLKNGIESLAQSNRMEESDIYLFVTDRISRGICLSN